MLVFAIHKVILYESFNLLNHSFSYLIQTPELWEVVPATTYTVAAHAHRRRPALWISVTYWDYVSCGESKCLWRGHGRFLRSHPHVSCPTVLPADEERWDAVCATVSSSKKL